MAAVGGRARRGGEVRVCEGIGGRTGGPRGARRGVHGIPWDTLRGLGRCVWRGVWAATCTGLHGACQRPPPCANGLLPAPCPLSLHTRSHVQVLHARLPAALGGAAAAGVRAGRRLPAHGERARTTKCVPLSGSGRRRSHRPRATREPPASHRRPHCAHHSRPRGSRKRNGFVYAHPLCPLPCCRHHQVMLAAGGLYIAAAVWAAQAALAANFNLGLVLVVEWARDVLTAPRLLAVLALAWFGNLWLYWVWFVGARVDDALAKVAPPVRRCAIASLSARRSGCAHSEQRSGVQEFGGESIPAPRQLRCVASKRVALVVVVLPRAGSAGCCSWAGCCTCACRPCGTTPRPGCPLRRATAPFTAWAWCARSEGGDWRGGAWTERYRERMAWHPVAKH